MPGNHDAVSVKRPKSHNVETLPFDTVSWGPISHFVNAFFGIRREEGRKKERKRGRKRKKEGRRNEERDGDEKGRKKGTLRKGGVKKQKEKEGIKMKYKANTRE